MDHGRRIPFQFMFAKLHQTRSKIRRNIIRTLKRDNQKTPFINLLLHKLEQDFK